MISVERKKVSKHYFLKIHSALTIAPTENVHEYKIVERKNDTSFLFVQIVPSSSGLASIRPARWSSRFSWRGKNVNKHYFLKFHSALTIAPTENFHKYKIVERKMAHLFLYG